MMEIIILLPLLFLVISVFLGMFENKTEYWKEVEIRTMIASVVLVIVMIVSVLVGILIN